MESSRALLPPGTLNLTARRAMRIASINPPRWLAHSVGVNARRISPIVTLMVSTERTGALRNKC
jgi:hypothetical protein